jgi:hypothetical protein
MFCLAKRPVKLWCGLFPRAYFLSLTMADATCNKIKADRKNFIMDPMPSEKESNVALYMD